jgi:hypothetical protein
MGEGFHQEALRGALADLHLQLLSRGPALEPGYMPRARVEGVQRTPNSKLHFRSIMWPSRDIWRHHYGTRKGIPDRIERGTSCYDCRQYNFKSLAQTFSMNFCADSKEDEGIQMAHHQKADHLHIYYQRIPSTPSEIRQDRSFPRYLPHVFEILRRTSFMS